MEAAEKYKQPIEEIFIKAKALSDKQYKELTENCTDSAICRYGTEKALEEANQKAFELVGYFNSKLSNLSYEAQNKFLEFIIDENSKEFNFIEENRTITEKAIVGLVESFIASQQAQGIKISPKIASFAKKTKPTNIIRANKPVFQRDSDAAKVAKELGYIKTNYRTKSGAAVFKKGNSYITRDVDGHNGGA